eukprot:TRINITY_DN6016_c0_g1_i1.p1 TRINITY_DN6016_c0_g1~~TRINITY_DN6016_c0_g1_i1.p1  ORF type:complete len:1248 (+),score=334.45 TRINITY_DN6016_c0_g1_i1:25-3768(+)
MSSCSDVVQNATAAAGLKESAASKSPARAQQPRPAATCPKCGNSYMEDSVFCRHCGLRRGYGSRRDVRTEKEKAGTSCGASREMAGAAAKPSEDTRPVMRPRFAGVALSAGGAGCGGSSGLAKSPGPGGGQSQPCKAVGGSPSLKSSSRFSKEAVLSSGDAAGSFFSRDGLNSRGKVMAMPPDSGTEKAVWRDTMARLILNLQDGSAPAAEAKDKDTLHDSTLSSVGAEESMQLRHVEKLASELNEQQRSLEELALRCEARAAGAQRVAADAVDLAAWCLEDSCSPIPRSKREPLLTTGQHSKAAETTGASGEEDGTASSSSEEAALPEHSRSRGDTLEPKSPSGATRFQPRAQISSERRGAPKDTMVSALQSAASMVAAAESAAERQCARAQELELEAKEKEAAAAAQVAKAEEEAARAQEKEAAAAAQVAKAEEEAARAQVMAKEAQEAQAEAAAKLQAAEEQARLQAEAALAASEKSQLRQLRQTEAQAAAEADALRKARSHEEALEAAVRAAELKAQARLLDADSSAESAEAHANARAEEAEANAAAAIRLAQTRVLAAEVACQERVERAKIAAEKDEASAGAAWTLLIGELPEGLPQRMLDFEVTLQGKCLGEKSKVDSMLAADALRRAREVHAKLERQQNAPGGNGAPIPAALVVTWGVLLAVALDSLLRLLAISPNMLQGLQQEQTPVMFTSQQLVQLTPKQLPYAEPEHRALYLQQSLPQQQLQSPLQCQQQSQSQQPQSQPQFQVQPQQIPLQHPSPQLQPQQLSRQPPSQQLPQQPLQQPQPQQPQPQKLSQQPPPHQQKPQTQQPSQQPLPEQPLPQPHELSQQQPSLQDQSQHKGQQLLDSQPSPPQPQQPQQQQQFHSELPQMQLQPQLQQEGPASEPEPALGYEQQSLQLLQLQQGQLQHLMDVHERQREHLELQREHLAQQLSASLPALPQLGAQKSVDGERHGELTAHNAACCRFCGVPFSDNSEFCQHCGHRDDIEVMHADYLMEDELSRFRAVPPEETLTITIGEVQRSVAIDRVRLQEEVHTLRLQQRLQRSKAHQPAPKRRPLYTLPAPAAVEPVQKNSSSPCLASPGPASLEAHAPLQERVTAPLVAKAQPANLALAAAAQRWGPQGSARRASTPPPQSTPKRNTLNTPQHTPQRTRQPSPAQPSQQTRPPTPPPKRSRPPSPSPTALKTSGHVQGASASSRGLLQKAGFGQLGRQDGSTTMGMTRGAHSPVRACHSVWRPPVASI